MTVANLGVNYKDAGRLKEAIPLLEEAHQAAKTIPSASLGRHGQLIDAYAKAGENAKLADLLQEQLAEARKTLPKDSPQLAGLLAQIGMSLLQQKKWTEAEPLLRECLAIREKTQPDVWSTFNTKSLLGGALLGQKKYAEAEPLLAEGLRGDEAAGEDDPAAGQHPPPRSPRPADRALHRHEQAGRSQEVASRAGEVPGGGPDAGGEEVTPIDRLARLDAAMSGPRSRNIRRWGYNSLSQFGHCAARVPPVSLASPASSGGFVRAARQIPHPQGARC